MSDSRYSRGYERHSRSRSRSPFRKNFNERPMDRDVKRPRKDMGRMEKPKRNRVFVNNIPFECRWMELKDLFREKVGDVTFVELFDDEKGKFSGTGVVEFKDHETAEKAISVMHKFDYRGRLLNVKEDIELDKGRSRPLSASRGMERDRRDRGIGFGGGGGGGDFRGDQHSFNTYGLNPEFLKSLGVSGPLTTKIFISNLDYKVTEKKLEEIFKLAGKLVKMDLNLDNDGKSKGHAIGEFEHPLEAVQAISMFSGQKLYARLLNVRMDRFADDEPSSKLPSGLHGIGKGLGANGQPMQFNRNSGGGGGVSNGNFGTGIGNMGNAVSGGMGVGASNLGMVSNSNMGMSSGSSLGLNNTMSNDRNMMNASSMGMGMVGSNLGSSMASGGSMGLMASSSGLMSSVMSSSVDNMGRGGNFPLSPSTPTRGSSYRDNFERGHDNFSSSLSDTIIIGNLPNNFSWQMLKDRFRDIGDVRYAEVKGRDTAMIRFNSGQDAQRAVNLMNGVRFDGRPMEVRFY